MLKKLLFPSSSGKFIIYANRVDMEVTNLSTTTDGTFSIPTKP